jgi:lipopolysaccharide transport system ATP-binding protein
MSHPAIKVEGLSKRYVLGKNERAGSFREAVTQSLSAPFRRLRSVKDGGGDQEFWALKDVNFEVQPGEVVGVIGRNGAGKSTLLKILSRITPPTSGSIRLRGRVASLLEVGTGFHPELTGRENIYLNGAMLGMRREEITRKFDEIVAFSEVEKFLDTPVKRYSSGMYVRLAFAVAAHLEPEILIVDEVLAVGDAAFQKKCVGKMRDVSSGDGRTVLFVSHNMAAIQTLCSVGLVLHSGNVHHFGSISESIAAYQSLGREARLDTQCKGEEFDLTSVRITSDEGVVRPLQPANFEFEFTPHQPSTSLGVHFYVEDAFGAVVFAIDSTEILPAQRGNAGDPVRCTIRIDKLPLIPGTYRVRTALRDDSRFLAWEAPVETEFDVQEDFVYGVRPVSRERHGLVCVKASAWLTPCMTQ